MAALANIYHIQTSNTGFTMTMNVENGTIVANSDGNSNKDKDTWALIPISHSKNKFKIQNVKSLFYLQLRNDGSVTCAQSCFHNNTTIHLKDGITGSTTIANDELEHSRTLLRDGDGTLRGVTDGEGQKWSFTSTGSEQRVEGTSLCYIIYATSSGKALTNTKGTITVQDKTPNNSNQIWALVPIPYDPKNSYKFQNVNNLMYLQVRNDGLVTVAQSCFDNNTSLSLKDGISGKTTITNALLDTDRTLVVGEDDNDKNRVQGKIGDDGSEWSFNLVQDSNEKINLSLVRRKQKCTIT